MIRIYEYGLLPPTLNAQLVEAQMRAGHRYRNMLIEIERVRRERVAAVLSGHVDTDPLAKQIAVLTEERERLRLEIKASRAATRSRSEAAEDRARVRDLGARIKDLREQFRAAKAAITTDPEIQAKLAEIEQWSRARVKEERARCGAYWGTYLLAEAAVDQARRSKTPPRFARWTGGGRVGVQLQGGIAVDDLTTDTQLQIHERVDLRTGRRAGTRKLLRMRIGSRVGSDGRAPIWAEWPLILHRALPDGARIKAATVQRRRRDCRSWDWRVQILVDIPDASARLAPDGGAVALNLGWARVDGGIRAGYVRGSDGATHEILVPSSIVDRIEKSESIRSIRDRNLDDVRPRLIESIGAIAGPPQELVERCEHMHAWRSPARFAALARWWRDHRFDGDAEAYELLESWRYRDEHLQRYEAGLLRGALGHRREIYRRLAAHLARRYRTLVVDDTDLRAMQRSPAPESERTEIDAAKRSQRLAAGSELRAALISAFGERRVVQLPAQDVTRTCHACGSIEQWDRAASGRLHTCSQCKVQWDQDDNACRNLLREWSRAADEWEAARARKDAERKESRSERLRRGRRKAA